MLLWLRRSPGWYQDFTRFGYDVFPVLSRHRRVGLAGLAVRSSVIVGTNKNNVQGQARWHMNELSRAEGGSVTSNIHMENNNMTNYQSVCQCIMDLRFYSRWHIYIYARSDQIKDKGVHTLCWKCQRVVSDVGWPEGSWVLGFCLHSGFSVRQEVVSMTNQPSIDRTPDDLWVMLSDIQKRTFPEGRCSSTSRAALVVDCGLNLFLNKHQPTWGTTSWCSRLHQSFLEMFVYTPLLYTTAMLICNFMLRLCA